MRDEYTNVKNLIYLSYNDNSVYISFFNGISTFAGYLIPKPSL